MNKVWVWIGACLSLGNLCAQSNATEEKINQGAVLGQLDERREQSLRQARTDELGCYEQFAVSDCLKAARLRNLERLAQIRKEEAELHSLQRKQRADEALRLQAQKKEEFERRWQEAAARSAPSNPSRAHRADPAAGPASGPLSGPTAEQAGQVSGDDKQGKAKEPPHRASPESRAEYQRKLLEAQKRREDRDKRVRDRVGGKQPVPLPTAP